MNIKKIKFDLNKRLYEKIVAKQGDTKSRFLLFQLLDSSVPFDLTNRSVRVYGLKKDGTEIFNDLIVNDSKKGYCTLELTNQMLALSGDVELELMIIEGQVKLTSNVFILEVRKSINSENSIVSTNEFTALLNGLAALNEYENVKENAEKIPEIVTEVKDLGSQLEHKVNNINYVYSKIKCDGVTDDSMVLLSELNNLNEKDCLITPKGMSVIDTTILMGSFKNNVELDFSATEFIEGNNTKVPFIFKLTNSKIKGLKINGNRDLKTFDDTKVGTDFLFKVDNGCNNIIFTGETKLYNAPFCACMWGQNIKNISFENLICENIGEHIHYKTGKLDVNSDVFNILFKNVYIKNVGINQGNATLKHFVQFFKVANDNGNNESGALKGVVIENMYLENIINKVEFCLFGCYNIKDCYVYNCKGDVDALISNGNILNICAYNSEFKRPFISNANLISVKGVKFFNCKFLGYVAHVNLVNVYENCVFDYYFTSSSVNDGVIRDNETSFINCTINCNTNCKYEHIYNNLIFTNCNFLSDITSQNSSFMVGFGEIVCIPNKKILITGGVNNSKFYSFLFSFRNTEIDFTVKDLIATGRIRSSVAVKKANIQNVEYVFASGYYTPVITDLDTVIDKVIINSKAGSNNLDNYVKGYTSTVLIGDKTLVIKNGLIQSVT